MRCSMEQISSILGKEDTATAAVSAEPILVLRLNERTSVRLASCLP